MPRFARRIKTLIPSFSAAYKALIIGSLFIFFGAIPSYSQKAAQNWYFGQNAGLDFSTSPPTPLTNGRINTREGVSSISDETTGQLLFYSEGTMVWNRNHALMPNGSGLLGDYSSTQSSVIVPNPANPNKYYLFTTALSQGMRYSEIDMTLQGGLGDIVTATKNTVLVPTNASTEKLIAVQHCNKRDFWVVTHTLNSNTFYVYLVNATGVQAPVTYNIGYSIGGPAFWEATGYLKFSPDGSKLAHVIGPASTGALSQVEVLSFNNQTGVLSGPVTALTNLNSPYGAEFSQSNKYLYISELLGKRLLQYDLTAANINASQYIITTSTNLLFGALQLGPDNKIYVSAENGYNTGYGYLGVINNPETAGAGCGYIQDAINLNGRSTLIGLPTFNATFLQKDTASVTYTVQCTNSSGTFGLTNTSNIDSVKWDFGDGSTGSQLLNPVHTYTSPNSYTVKVIIYRSCNVNDTISKPVTIGNCAQPLVTASFTAPDTVCISNAVTINNTSVDASSYFWNFCTGNLNNPPVGTNLGNIAGAMSSPVYIDYVLDNGKYYGFVTDNYSGKLFRLDFGNNLLNPPTLTNFGNLNGTLPVSVEGIQVIKNEGKWYAIIVGGEPAIGVTPFVIKVEFGANITNPNPTAVNWGNLGNMQYPHDLYVFNDGPNWYGLTVNTNNNTITRFNFTNSFSNTPTAVNLGNIGNLVGPTGIHAIKEGSNWYAFVTNANGNTITRLDFGTSLLNTPAGQNLGNPGGQFNTPWDIYVIKFCGEMLAYVINASGSSNSLLKLDFNSSITNTPVVTNFGNIGNLNFPHCLSKIFRAGADLYTFVPNVSNQTLSRVQFPGCTNASQPNSTDQNPAPIIYNTPGIYNINLTVDDGLPTQTTFCKQVVVLPAPVQSPTKTSTLCTGAISRIGTGTKQATYLWNTGATTDSIDISNVGTYWVTINRFGCSVTDTFKVERLLISDFGFKQDVCNPYMVTFANASTATASPWWDLGDGTIVTGNLNPVHTYTTFANYTIRFSVQNGNCVDTVDKIISINVLPDDIIITPDTTICDKTTKQLRTKPSLSFCWFPTTYLDNPNSPNPVTSTPHDITYYFHAEVTGNNLITNGDFSAGNTGFTSQYNYAANNTTEGQYYVGASPQAWNASLSPCTDHTTGNGNMMLINGSPAADVNVWTQTITVTPNTNYAFSTWIQALWNPNPAILQFSINGKDIGNLITASLPTCTWSQFYTTWNSGNNTTATIAIVNKNTQIQGNDFALDDISFAPVFIKRDSVIIKVDTPVVKTILDTTVCKEKPVTLYTTGAATYTWSPATALSNPAIANPVASPAASTQYIVTGTTIHGCVAKDTVNVNIFAKPVIARTQDTTVCRNTTFPLYIAGGTSYTWSPASQVSDPTSNTPIASAGTTDITYHVAITDNHSCISQDSVQVSIRPYPVFTASGDQAICDGASTTLHAGGGDQFQWTPGHLLSDPGSPGPVAIPEATTQFSVYIRETTCGFDTTINMLITVNPNPVITVEKANDVNCNTPTAQLQASGALQYTWRPTTGLDDPAKANPIAAIDTTTKYEVSGANQFGCASSAFIELKVTKDGIPRFVLPNAFTPNGDRNNDCFGIKRWGNAKVEEFAVYNRWGQQVFFTSNPAQCWDGTFRGQPQDAGGYIYVIRARTLCGEVTRKGMVMLIR